MDLNVSLERFDHLLAGTEYAAANGLEDSSDALSAVKDAMDHSAIRSGASDRQVRLSCSEKSYGILSMCYQYAGEAAKAGNARRFSKELAERRQYRDAGRIALGDGIRADWAVYSASYPGKKSKRKFAELYRYKYSSVLDALAGRM